MHDLLYYLNLYSTQQIPFFLLVLYLFSLLPPCTVTTLLAYVDMYFNFSGDVYPCLSVLHVLLLPLLILTRFNVIISSNFSEQMDALPLIDDILVHFYFYSF